MITHYQPKYRSLEELINTVSVDLHSIYSDGVIEIAEIIKVVQRCNYELGLQINQTKETILDVEHFRTKLPNDFQFLNFARICHRHTVVSELFPPGLIKVESILPVTFSSTLHLTSCPCWQVDTVAAQSFNVTDFFTNVVTETSFSAGLTRICAKSVTIITDRAYGPYTITTDSFCYNNPATATLTCNIPDDCACDITPVPCNVPDVDPWLQNRVRTICDGTIGIKIEQSCGTQVRHYEHTEPLFIQPCRRASGFSCAEEFRVHGNIAYIRDNYLELGRECCKVYMNYQGLMEDDQGNLIVIDHPLINDYYEYSVKRRIMENLYINGEPDIERRLQLLDTRYTKAKHDAMVVAYTPDWQVIVQTYQKERQDENEKHFAPFSQWYGRYAGYSWMNEWANFRYRE